MEEGTGTLLALKIGVMWPHAMATLEHMAAVETAGGQEMNSVLEPLESSALLTSRLWLSDTDLALLTSRTLREYISVVLCHCICGTCLKQPQETNTARIRHVDCFSI